MADGGQNSGPSNKVKIGIGAAVISRLTLVSSGFAFGKELLVAVQPVIGAMYPAATNEEPTTEAPAKEEPTTEAPAKEEPTKEEPATDAPINPQPVSIPLPSPTPADCRIPPPNSRRCRWHPARSSKRRRADSPNRSW